MRSKLLGSPVASAAAALLCTTLVQRLATRQSELYSDLLCWSILPLLCRFLGKLKATSHRIDEFRSPDVVTKHAVLATTRKPASPEPLKLVWLVTIGIAIVTVFSTELPQIELYPALTPLLLAIQLRYQLNTHESEVQELGEVMKLHNTLWGTSTLALFSTLALATGTYLCLALPLIPMMALLLVYTALMVAETQGRHLLELSPLGNSVDSLSQRIVLVLLGVLAVQTTVFAAPKIQWSLIVFVGILKAVSWYYISETAFHTSWRIATSIGTFSRLATVDPLSYDSDFRALSFVVASLLVIAQIIAALPKTAVYRAGLWVFVIIPLASYMAVLSETSRAQTLAKEWDQPLQLHPIEALFSDASIKFDNMRVGQSKTYSAACDEYRHRYSMDPPPGFQRWYEFATLHHSPIIDDFDTMYTSLKLIWRLSGQEVAHLMTKAQAASGSELWHCTFFGSSAHTSCEHPYRSFDRHISLEFNKTLSDLRGVLPDVKFLVNHFDEPAVLVPHPHAKSGVNDHESFRMTYMSRKPIWQDITKLCTPGQSLDDARAAGEQDVFGLPFVVNRTSAIDLCRHAEYRHLHGFFRSPTSFRAIEAAVPILSTGVPSVMGDILFPSPAYSESEFQYDESHDVDWEQKRNNLYWAGSTTGGFVRSEGWLDFHRQRFIDLVQNPDRNHQYFYLQPENGRATRAKSSFLDLRQYDVAFTKTSGCDMAHCRDQRTHFKLKSWADKDQALRSRLVFDIDGNGISGRYYKLLASKSAPLKMTIFREWHEDRLLPWFHYIPISLGMEELPELIRYLTSTNSGRKRAAEIAKQGREWHTKAFRDVDKTIYLYRLLLELARLQDPTREGV